MAPLVTEIWRLQLDKIVTAQPSAITIFILIRSFNKDSLKVLKMPLLEWRVSSIAKGLNTVIVVVTDEERINKKLYGVPDWIPTVMAGKVKNGFLITINKIQKLETLWSILKAERITELRKAGSLNIAQKRPLDTPKYLVGISEILEDFERTCWQETGSTRKIICLYGQAGCGKTTLATSFFKRNRSKYTKSSFLSGVRLESTWYNLTSLQSELLKDLVHEDRIFNSIPDVLGYLRSRLGRGPLLSFLICIDDIDDLEQLDALVGWDIGDNSTSSLIIVTTRDERFLIQAGVSARYKMREMNEGQSTELFCWHVFHQPYPSSGYEDLVKSFVKECMGLPKALKVLGQLVFGSPDKLYWDTALEEMRKTLSAI